MFRFDTGAEMIAAERARQVSGEGYSDAHDDHYTDRELTRAAVAYALGATDREDADDYWPRGWAERKPTDSEIGDLVKAGALIAAEIDRIQRRINA